MLEEQGKTDPLFDELLFTFGRPLWKQDIAALADVYGDLPSAMHTLLRLAIYPNNEIGFRATWVLETACLANNFRILPILETLVARFPLQKNQSAQRHFGKLICIAANPKAPDVITREFRQLDLTPVIDTLFDWLVSETPVAVKANAMEALTLLIPVHSWIREELLATIDHLVDRESIAFHGRVKRIRPLILGS